MKQTNTFQIVFLAVFILAGVIAMLVFSGKINIGKNEGAGSGGTVILWGTAKYSDLSKAIEAFNDTNPSFTVRYVQKYADSFDQDLLSALASGTGPDMFFLPDTLAYSYKNRIANVPYNVFPLDVFKQKFAGAGEVFLTAKGILAFPITIDPLVMYYNRTILDNNALVYPPTYWDEVPNLVSVLTKKDDAKKITSTAVALGQFENITHAKDIISALFMQTGNPIVTEQQGRYVAALGENLDTQKLASALGFYTDFSDPLKNTYSWNRSLQDSQGMFSAEKLAFYFGFASELQSLKNKNPNQNFQVAPVPQLRGASAKVTSARVTGIAVSSFSKNFNSAFTAASLMSTGDFAARYAFITGTVPVRRDLLTVKQKDEFSPTFYTSALYAKSWLDPAPTTTDSIFSHMIDSVLSGSLTTEQAIKDAGGKLSFTLVKN